MTTTQTAAVTPITEAPKAAATRRSRASRAAETSATKTAVKVQITAPKGGTQTVAPRKGAVAKAIKASGSTIMGISRTHGLNPSQMRRLSLDQVSKVDLPRAEAIAQALGTDLGKLFEAPVDKAAAAKTAAAK